VPLDRLDWPDCREILDQPAKLVTTDFLVLKAKSEILDVLVRLVILVSLFITFTFTLLMLFIHLVYQCCLGETMFVN